jgi:hypothetical protein
MGVTWFLIIIWLLSGIGGSLIAQSKNRPPWQGALLGFVLGILGVFIIAVMSKQPAPTASQAADRSERPRTRVGASRPSLGSVERPQAAVERIKEAQDAYERGAYPRAIGPLWDELYEAGRRGDVESIEIVASLAEQIEQRSDAHRRIRSDAARLAQSAMASLGKWQTTTDRDGFEPDPDEESLAGTDEDVASDAEAASLLDIIGARYARGEVTRDEYLQLKADLIAQ